jgi:GNAT superfamily N-acetyltransferase
MLMMTNTIRPDEYMAMRKAVGWHEFPLEQAAEGLKNCYIWCIREDDRPIALGRIIWDHGYVIYIADVIVLPEHQGQGLGRKIMETMMDFIRAQMKPGYLFMVSLMSAKGKNEFYKKFGFVDRPSEQFGPGMHQWLEGDKET